MFSEAKFRFAHSVFIDESFQLPEARKPETYYLLCAVKLPKESTNFVRHRVLEISGKETWHSTDLLKTNSGRDLILEMCQLISQTCEPLVFVKQPISKSDRLGEQARANLFRLLLQDPQLNKNTQENSLVYEKRLPGIQANADLRVIQDAHRLGLIGSSTDIRPRYKSEEPLLWLADTVASAYRQFHTARNSEYWNILSKNAQTKWATD
jgi:hypothetical protein